MTDVPERLLRAAHARCRIARVMPFEEAMQQPMFRTCLRHLALSLAVKGILE